MTAIRVTHIGGPTTLLEVDGWRILTDPTFDAPGRSYAFGWGSSSTKLVGPAVPVDALGPIDAVLVTHDHHADNLDDAGRALLPSAGTVVTTTSGATRLGGGARGLDPWATTTLQATGKPSIVVTATPCRHGPPLSHPIVGDVIGFALDVEGGTRGTIWISGDTVLYPGVREVARRVEVDVALVHMGAVRFKLTGPVRYTMTAREAVALCAEVRPRVTVPVHYEGWSHFSQGRAELEAALADAPADVQAQFCVVPIGEPTDLPEARVV